jgi:hypothetical protein
LQQRTPRCAPGVRALGSQEVAARSHHLAEERAETARLLRGLGRELGAHSPLVARLGGPAVTARMLGLPNDALACVFDLDGVLTMSAEAHAAAWTQVFDAFLVEHAQRHQRPLVAFDPRHDYEELVAGRPRRDGIRAFLASRGVHLPEGSPSDAPGIETVYGLDGHTMAVEQLEAKPAPDLLLVACHELRVEPSRAVAFERPRRPGSQRREPQNSRSSSASRGPVRPTSCARATPISS